MSRNFIVIKVNLDLLNPVLLHVVYTVVVIIVDMYDYLSEDSVPRGALDRAGVLGLSPPPPNRT